MNYFNYPSRLALAFWCLTIGLAVSTPGPGQGTWLRVTSRTRGDPALDCSCCKNKLIQKKGYSVQSIIKSDIEASFPGEEQCCPVGVIGRPSILVQSFDRGWHISKGQWQPIVDLVVRGFRSDLWIQ